MRILLLELSHPTYRIRKKGEVNGKSGNLNNALRNVIYKNYPKNELGQIDWTEISNKECIVVFDADMNCKSVSSFTSITIRAVRL
jgi:hypothetical protein